MLPVESRHVASAPFQRARFGAGIYRYCWPSQRAQKKKKKRYRDRERKLFRGSNYRHRRLEEKEKKGPFYLVVLALFFSIISIMYSSASTPRLIYFNGPPFLLSFFFYFYFNKSIKRNTPRVVTQLEWPSNSGFLSFLFFFFCCLGGGRRTAEPRERRNHQAIGYGPLADTKRRHYTDILQFKSALSWI